MKRLIVPVIMLAAVAAFAQTRPPQRFSWTRPVAGEPAVSYVVQARENGGSWVTVAATAYTFHVFEDLSLASVWEIRVAGVDGLGRQGAFSAPSLPLDGDQGPPGTPGVPVLENP